jgi:Holliday junction resolvase RusA-like endonuclease
MVPFRVDIPGVPPSPNTQVREVRQQQARERAKWRKDAGWLAKEARAGYEAEARRGNVGFGYRMPLDVYGKVMVRVVHYRPDHIKRDWDNLAAGIKPLMDGLVDAGVISDDSVQVIQRMEHIFQVRPKQAGTEILVWIVGLA